MCAKSFQSCLTLCDPMDCRPPGSSVHGIFQARILEWVAMLYSARSQREELHPWQRSWGRRLGIRKGGIEPQETPCSWASTPKTRVCLLYCFMLSSTPLTLGGASPPTSLGEGVNLQLQLIKIPGHDKSVSTYKLLWRFSSLPEQVHPATCDCLQPPDCERHEMF